MRNEELDNKNIRTEYSTEQWVVAAEVGRNPDKGASVIKRVAKGFFRKHAFKYTVLLNKALRFNEKHLAERFMQDNDVTGKPLPVHYALHIVTE